jgi:glycosyltransferase involved in cell wall biosynthesis
VVLPAVIAAYNEEPRVGAVVRTLLSTGLFSPVIVVDDGSSDRTVEAAAAAGAKVVRQPRNTGKAQAMKAGWLASGGGDVAFFDADLTNLLPEHCATLLSGYEAGYDQTCGLRDYSVLMRPAQVFGPIITGERIVRAWVLQRVPENCWRGFDIETAINAACDRGGGRTALFFLQGMNHTMKGNKRGFVAGWLADLRMFMRIREVRKCLVGSEGTSCPTE